MRRILCLICMFGLLAGCSEKDPVLPGHRTAVFEQTKINILNTPIENIGTVVSTADNCEYTQDASNVVWRGDKKIFSGFPTSNSVKSTQKPVCAGKYIYVGLTTGELVKINPTTRDIAWIADIYRPSNMTGGASVLDIVAPIVVNGDAVYVGGLGDAVCRVAAENGIKKWCVPIGTAHAFVVTSAVVFVMATDNNVYALRTSDGAAYWKTPIKKAGTVEFDGEKIKIGRITLDAKSGKIVK